MECSQDYREENPSWVLAFGKGSIIETSALLWVHMQPPPHCTWLHSSAVCYEQLHWSEVTNSFRVKKTLRSSNPAIDPALSRPLVNPVTMCHTCTSFTARNVDLTTFPGSPFHPANNSTVKNWESFSDRQLKKKPIGRVFTSLGENICMSVLLVLGRTLHFKACCASPRQLKILTDEHGWGLDSGSLQQKCENQVISDFYARATASWAHFPTKAGKDFPRTSLWVQALNWSTTGAFATLFRLHFKQQS